MTSRKTTRRSSSVGSHSEDEHDGGKRFRANGKTFKLAALHLNVQRNDKKSPSEADKEALLQQIWTKYQTYFAIYSLIKPDLQKTEVLFRQRALSYMVHRQRDYKNREAANTLKDDKENINQCNENTAIEIVLLFLDRIKGEYKSAIINWYIVKQTKSNRSHEPGVPEKIYLASTNYDFSKKHFFAEPVLVEAHILAQINDNFKYSLGYVVKFSTKSSLEESSSNSENGVACYSGNIEVLEPLLTGEFSTQMYKQHQLEKNSQLRPSQQSPGDFNFSMPHAKTSGYNITFRIDKRNPGNSLTRQIRAPCSASQLQTRKILKELQNTSSNSIPAAPVVRPLQSERLKVRIIMEMLNRNLFLTDYVCPFCDVDCDNFKTLAIHLKTSHDRFSYKVEYNPCQIITMSINRDFDGSFELDPRNNTALTMPQKCISQREGTCVLVSNELRNYQANFNQVWNCNYDLLEIMNYSHERMSSDKRTYYHSQTCIPILPHEIDIDSEDDNYSEYTDWTKNRNVALIDEFTDVNPGEKEITKMWNLHVMKNSKISIGECHIGNVAKLFVEKHARTLITKKLKLNLILHLCNLHSFGLVKAKDMEVMCMQMNKLEQEMMKEKEGYNNQTKIEATLVIEFDPSH